MKYLAGLILLIALFHTMGFSQENEPSSIKYIIIDSSKAKISDFKRIIKPGEDFYRKKKLVRLDLLAPGNEPLLNANRADNIHKGIVSVIIQGLEAQELIGRHPSNLGKSFDYYDLIYQLMELEGIEPDPMGDSIRISDLGWESMMESIDLIVDEGISNRNSRKFFRIAYLRLIWENPFTAQGKKIVMVFPYDQQLRRFLETIDCPVENGNQKNLNAREFLELGEFKGRRIQISQDQAQPIDSQMNRERNAIFKIEEIWQH